MFLFVGLGNYGDEYNNTRHNAGFIVVDNIIREYNFRSEGKKFHSELYSGSINCEKGYIIKPQTYMNRSGIAVCEISRFYKIPLNRIFVFHDDMDINLGKIKYKVGGSSAGHNGIKSIDEMIGKDYNRIRIGIGRPQYKDDVINFVLNRFTEDERIALENASTKIVNNANTLLNNIDLFLTNIAK